MGVCTVEDCGRPSRARGFCKTHYTEARAAGLPAIRPGPPAIPAIDRFWAKVEKTDTCWLWKGARVAKGYGSMLVTYGVTVSAHRYAYEQLVGPIPAGLTLDHLCRVRHCVNPAHLEPVTAALNTTRGDAGLWNKVKTHCPKGHPYDEANTSWKDGKNGRQRECKRCRADQERLRREFRR